MIDESGWMRYAYRHDVDASIETGMWLNPGRSRRSLWLAAFGSVVGVLSVVVHSWVLGVVAVGIIVEVLVHHVWRLRRARARFRALHAVDAEVAFCEAGVWSRDLGQATFPWTFFTGWTIRRGALLVLRQVKPHGVFLRLPMSAVPADEWQPLTNLIWERLGPAGTPDSVRRYHEVKVTTAAEQ